MQSIFIIFYAISCLLLTGCSPLPINLQVQTAQALNQNVQGRSLPVIVRIYQLKDDLPFLNASFSQLWKNDQRTLGQSLLSRREVTLAPNSSRQITIQRQRETKYLAVMGLFTRPADDRWRKIQLLSQPVGSWLFPMTVEISNSTVLMR